MIDKNDLCIYLIYIDNNKNRLFLIAVAECFSDGLCLVEREAMLMTFFAVWGGGQNGGQIRGYAYFQVVDAMTGKAGLATATHFP
ncbi:hypothetical protein ACM92Y_004287 [Cronobacter malonaticus]|uniref:hypothetical protein n=1 Tax=Cronobacter TaxID=413496 RepID=UPI001C0D5B4B|nr:hypothetical protein [Cronobacter malonaticus]ELY4078300.1 hypothetical protein [Cronobacter sakazakii]ELY4469424.1 hypothetical protein [Cronobacter sakazakii]ELY6313140.1 hypothetical protein [Cronobacter sakazakii]QWR85492.1 hypothetical protein G4U61_13190 [Cronobacter sakazakii]